MRHNLLHSALEEAMPSDPRGAYRDLMSSLEDIQEADQQEARQANLTSQVLTLADTVRKEHGPDSPLNDTIVELLTQVGAGSGIDVVSTEGLGSIFTSLSGFFKTRKPNGELPSKDSDYTKRQQAVAKFITEMDKTYLNSSWLAKQKFVEGTISAGDISANFVIDGKLGDKPLANIDTAKKRVQAFITKWEAVLNELSTKVTAIDRRVKAATKGASEDDKAAIQLVVDAVKEFNSLPDPMAKLPKLEGTSLGNKVFDKDKYGQLTVVVSTAPESSPTLPALSKEEVLECATLVKMMLKNDWEPEMKYFPWLDHSDGSAFNDWIYEADYSTYEEYYDQFYHQSAGQAWTYATHYMFDMYQLAGALIKWIDRSVK